MNIIDLKRDDYVMYEGDIAIVEEIDLRDNSVYVTTINVDNGGWVFDVENMEKCND